MNKTLHLIYVPGLGDQDPKGQQRAVNFWNHYNGVTAELYQMNWADQKPYGEKFKRLLQLIDQRLSEGKNVALVGASAGAGAVINAFAARKDDIVGCVLIAGKVNRPNFISSSYKRRNPAFVDSALGAPDSLASLSRDDRGRILSIFGLVDEVVYKPDSYIPGAHNRLSPSVGHFFNIAFQLTIGAPFFIRFLKHQSVKN